MKPLKRLRSLPLRGKVVMTVLGAAIATLGASTYLSFRYWRNEALATTEQQALLAAGSTRATVESALRLDRPEPARHTLARLREEGAITAARVYGAGNEILLSADRFEEGRSSPAIWIPHADELPSRGLVNALPDGQSVRAFVPLSLPEPAVLVVEFSVAATKAAMDRGARLGIGLMAVSLVSVALIVLTMFEREVVGPLHRMDDLLRANDPKSRTRRNGNEIRDLEHSVTRLIEMETRAEARVADQAGLVEVGELAAEMAHEFKRPLASIRAGVDMLQQEYSLNGGGRAMLDALDVQLERLHETMHDLLSLAKPIVPEPTPVDIAVTLDEALSELAGLPALEGIEIRRVYEEGSIQVPGDARRLRQVFLNVLLNGAEAMPGGGLLVIEARTTCWGAEISFTDAGGGLEANEVQMILKPFYSTKPLGTGLGLPLVARVVAAHHGGLAIESIPGRGTTVRVTLPLISELTSGRA